MMKVEKGVASVREMVRTLAREHAVRQRGEQS